MTAVQGIYSSAGAFSRKIAQSSTRRSTVWTRSSSKRRGGDPGGARGGAPPTPPTETREKPPPNRPPRPGNRLYGCDTCQEVCPWNRFARPTQIEAFRPKPALLSLRKEDLKVFSREDYNRIFAKSAVKRAKYEGLIRNIHNLKD